MRIFPLAVASLWSLLIPELTLVAGQTHQQQLRGTGTGPEEGVELKSDAGASRYEHTKYKYALYDGNQFNYSLRDSTVDGDLCA